jgi:hypothetical protein
MASLILRILFCCNGPSDSVLFVLYYPLVPTHHSVKFEVSGHPNPGTVIDSPISESLGRIVKRIVRRGAAFLEVSFCCATRLLTGGRRLRQCLFAVNLQISSCALPSLVCSALIISRLVEVCSRNGLTFHDRVLWSNPCCVSAITTAGSCPCGITLYW